MGALVNQRPRQAANTRCGFPDICHQTRGDKNFFTGIEVELERVYDQRTPMSLMPCIKMSGRTAANTIGTLAVISQSSTVASNRP